LTTGGPVVTNQLDLCLPQGTLLKENCQVAFNIIIPEDVTARPWFSFTSHGTHTHPPPPPTKTPAVILKEIEQIIDDIGDPNATTGKLLDTNWFLTGC
jgi:hypothetical protein